jgi:hypothetical protein
MLDSGAEEKDPLKALSTGGRHPYGDPHRQGVMTWI